MSQKQRDDKLPEDWLQVEEVPTLRILPSRLDDAVASSTTDLLLLAVYNVLFFMGAYLRFLRYDVT